MMKRNFHTLLLAGAMLLSLAACGTNAAGPSDTDADAGANTSQSPVTVPAAEPAQTSGQTVKLTLESVLKLSE